MSGAIDGGLPMLALVGPPAAGAWEAERAAVGGRVHVEPASGDLASWWTETRTLARLQHPAIPPLHEVGVLPDGRVARLRAAVSGRAWSDVAPAQPPHALAGVLLRAAEALAHAHARGVVHGRFGAEALLLGESGQVWVLGWGAGAGAPAGAAAGASAEGDVAALVALIEGWLGPAPLGEPDPRAPPTAAGVAARLQAWLDGADRRGRAREWASRAEAHVAAGTAAEHAHGTAARIGRLAVATAPTHEPEATRHAAWALEDEAEALRRAAKDHVHAARRALHAALEQDPALPEAHAAMAQSWSTEVTEAEREGAPAAEARARVALRAHVDRLPPAHTLRARDDRFLRGTGAVTLLTDPPGARVTAERYEEVDHRLVLRPAGVLGRTPLHAVDLAPGSYRLHVTAEGRAPAVYPVHIERHAHWDGVPPGETAPYPVRLLPPESLGPDDCYVPAGWFSAGARGASVSVWPRRLWCEGFVIRRFPVTARELLAWLDALVDAGEEERALALAPRTSPRAGVGPLHYPRAEDGRFLTALAPDRADWPAQRIAFATAAAYTNALRATTGLPWRLPMELEWEKSARGVDGRPFPWGRRKSLRWANLSVPGEPESPGPVAAFPFDESPYGVRGVAGNIADWTVDPFELLGPALPDRRVAVVDPTPDLPLASVGVYRGCAFEGRDPHLASREPPDTSKTHSSLGFRLTRSLP